MQPHFSLRIKKHPAMKMNLTIGKKMMLGFSLALLIIVAIGDASYRNTSKLVETFELVTHTHQVLNKLENLVGVLIDIEASQRGYIITGDEKFLEAYQVAITAVDQKFKDLRHFGEDSSNLRWRLDALAPLLTERLALAREAVALRQTNNLEAAQKAIAAGTGKKLIDDIQKLTGEMADEQRALINQRSEAAAASAQRIISIIVSGSIAAILMLALAGFLITRSITQPLAAFMDFAERVGKGDLTHQAANSTSDEVGKLGHALNEMVGGLREVATQTRAASENLNSAAAQIMASTQQQVASSGEQAAAVQETAATVQEISQTGAQVAEKAKKLASTAEATAGASTAGLEAVQNTNRIMECIREQAEAVAGNIVTLSEKTQAVGEIITTVNDIAERSNLLALNAAIEAAAAGEQGRSFSVVAGEIKNLADQAKEATVQVRAILGDIQNGINTSVMLTEEAVKRVDSGKRQADVTEHTIRQMSNGIQESVQAFQQILASTNQQQIGLEQVTQAMKNIRQATEQTALGTGQLQKATTHISALGQQLCAAVSRYQI